MWVRVAEADAVAVPAVRVPDCDFVADAVPAVRVAVRVSVWVRVGGGVTDRDGVKLANVAVAELLRLLDLDRLVVKLPNDAVRVGLSVAVRVGGGERVAVVVDVEVPDAVLMEPDGVLVSESVEVRVPEFADRVRVDVGVSVCVRVFILVPVLDTVGVFVWVPNVAVGVDDSALLVRLRVCVVVLLGYAMAVLNPGMVVSPPKAERSRTIDSNGTIDRYPYTANGRQTYFEPAEEI